MMLAEYKRENKKITGNEEKGKLRDFFVNVIQIKDEALLEYLVRESYRIKFKKNDIVMHENDMIIDLPIIMSGIIKGFRTDSSGRERISCFGYRPGDIAAGIVNLSREMKSLQTVQVIKDSEVVCIPIRILVQLLESNQELLRIYCMKANAFMEHAVERERIVTVLSAEERYNYFIEKFPELLDCVTKKDIASYLNITAECLSRVLKRNSERAFMELDKN